MMIEYPPQTFLLLIDLGWKCSLVGKLIDSCSRIKHKISCILSNIVIGQTSYKSVYTYGLVHVNCHIYYHYTRSNDKLPSQKRSFLQAKQQSAGCKWNLLPAT